MTTRERKKRNKEHCKGRPFKVRLQCWYFRNEMEIKTVALSAITSLITHIVIMFILTVIAILTGMEV